jgi:adenosyl cobinamide kinase/adenosyl cobinamide phosphate guanylyltransferase
VITLVIGGARSGKSSVGESIATRLADERDVQVTYVATMWPAEGDADLAARLDVHRRRRPDSWTTVEPPYVLAEVLAACDGVVLLDSLGSWVSAQPDMTVDLAALTDAVRGRRDPTVIVTDEVGWGVHPETELGRRFRDQVGRVNTAVADAADDVLLVVAGRMTRLERP